MIDPYTGKRVIVQIDEILGPYIYISESNEGIELTDQFSDYFIFYWPPDYSNFVDYGGSGGRYCFGSLADPIKLQAILDEIYTQDERE